MINVEDIPLACTFHAGLDQPQTGVNIEEGLVFSDKKSENLQGGKIVKARFPELVSYISDANTLIEAA